ncbi:small RNA degrading nuclease 1 [Senna tora]|uniref:Small RNA degrading nuclease 1 n=1 Tax=Senna tora TaxID=362788 RepID=A0A834STT8_9FABA|nr:small RNA degrading nuclease 1 [Senna tora]
MKGWVIINLRLKNMLLRSTKMVAVDCEMVLCEDGTDAVVKVCVVDRNLEVKLDKLVRPYKKIVDYRTEITGVSAQDLEGITCSLADVQKSMKKLLSNGTILVGHSLHNDLRVLKLDYIRVIDTSYIFLPLDGPIHKRPSLNNLLLGYPVREIGAPHNCLDDATAAMKLVLAKIKHGVDNDDIAIPLIQEPVPESQLAKLLLHRISTSVKIEELHEVVPGRFTLELKPPKGDKYSAFAIFKNPQEAYDAFEEVQGSQDKDSCGRSQKLVTFQLSSGMTSSLYVRKMAPDDPLKLNPSKRALEVAETNVFKKARMDPEREEEDAETNSNMCETHLKEIEALNQRLKQSDLEIENLRQQLKQNESEIESLRQQLKQDVEVESLRQQLKQKDYEINVLNKMVASLNMKQKRSVTTR